MAAFVKRKYTDEVNADLPHDSNDDSQYLKREHPEEVIADILHNNSDNSQYIKLEHLEEVYVDLPQDSSDDSQYTKHEDPEVIADLLHHSSDNSQYVKHEHPEVITDLLHHSSDNSQYITLEHLEEVCVDLPHDSSDDSQYANSSDIESSSDSDACSIESIDSEFVWCDIDLRPHSELPFTGSPGRKAEVADISDPLQYFNLMITNEMLDNIVVETNRRAQQLIHHCTLKPNSRLRAWVDIDRDELLVFVALIVYQGIIQKPEIEMYWSTKPLLETPYVRQVMAERRFNLIMKCLHFVDNSNLPVASHASEQSFFKIKPFFDALINRFSSVYIPEQNVAVVDESRMLWKGSLATKECVPLRRHRSSLKSYELCECGSGYIWKVIVHTGTAVKLNETSDGLLSSGIVLTLAKDLLGKGYRIFMNSWYSSPSLFRQLRKNQTDAVGTLRLNRKNVPEQIKKKVASGHRVACFTTDMMALKWADKQEVGLLSTYHRNDMTKIKTRCGETEKPVSVAHYNSNMGAVDVAESVLVAYPVECKRQKMWYKKQFRHLLNMAILNSYILFKKDNAEVKMNHLQFRIKLVERLLETYHDPKHIRIRGWQSSDESNPLRLTARHFPSLIPPTAKKEGPTGRCKVCCSHVDKNGKKVRRETRYFCKDCNVALCAAPCFGVYHTKKNY